MQHAPIRPSATLRGFPQAKHAVDADGPLVVTELRMCESLPEGERHNILGITNDPARFPFDKANSAFEHSLDRFFCSLIPRLPASLTCLFSIGQRFFPLQLVDKSNLATPSPIRIFQWKDRLFPDPLHFSQGNYLFIRNAYPKNILVKKHGNSSNQHGWVCEAPEMHEMYLWSEDLELLFGEQLDDYPSILAELQKLRDYRVSYQPPPAPAPVTPSQAVVSAPSTSVTPSASIAPVPAAPRPAFSTSHLTRYTLNSIPQGNTNDFCIVVKILGAFQFTNHNKHVKQVLVWDGTGSVEDEMNTKDELIAKVEELPLTGAIKQIAVWQTVFNRFPEPITAAGCWVRLSGLYVKTRDGTMDISSRDTNFKCEAVEPNDPIVIALLAAAANNPFQRMPRSALQATDSYMNPQASIIVPSHHTVVGSNQIQSQLPPEHYANDHHAHTANKRPGSLQYADEPPVAKRPAPLEYGRVHSSPHRTAPVADETLDYIPVDPLLSTTTTKISISATNHASTITYASRVKGKLSGDYNVSELYRVRGYLQYIWPCPSKSQPSDFIRKTCATCHMIQQEGQLPSHLSTCQGRQYSDIIYFVLKVGDDHDSINIQVTGSAAETFVRCTAKHAKANLQPLHKLLRSLEREVGNIADFFVVATSASRPSDPPSFLLFGTEFNELS